MFPRVTNHDSPSGIPIDKSWVRWLPGESSLSDCIVPSAKFVRREIMVWGCFSRAMLSPFVPMNGTLNSSALQDILEHFML